MKVRYAGPMESRIVWGRVFPSGVVIELKDPDLCRKVQCLSGFELVEDEAEEEPVEEIAADWQNLHWKQKVKLARDLTGLTCANGSEADEVLTAHFEGKLNA